MKIFTCVSNGTIAIVSAFNRGHAVKLLTKRFEKENLGPVGPKTVFELDVTLNGRKGNVAILAEGSKV